MALALAFIGVVFIINAGFGLPFLWLVLVIFLVVMISGGIFRIVLHKSDVKKSVIYVAAHTLILILIVKEPHFYARSLGLITGLYILLNALIYFIDYQIARRDHLKGILTKLATSILYLLFSLSLIFFPLKSSVWIFVLSGIYLLIAGGIKLVEVLSDIFKKHFNVTLSLPVVLGALISVRIYNSFSKDRTLMDRAISDPKLSERAPLEVFIYLRDGFFESFGHVDIAFEGVIYSYGLHDPLKRRVFGSAGDGVLIKADREAFLENCLKSGKTIILDFKLYPGDEKLKTIKERIDALMENAVPWDCEAKKQELKGEKMDAQDYISDVYRDTHCELYKFKRGLFKTYFVFTTNCVGLADYLIRNSEIDLLNITGIVTPGNYLNFLYQLYSKGDTIVKDLTILKK